MNNIKTINNVTTIDKNLCTLICTNNQYNKIINLLSLFGQENVEVCGFDDVDDNGYLCGLLTFSIKDNCVCLGIFNDDIGTQYDNEEANNVGFCLSIDENGIISKSITIDYNEIQDLIAWIKEEE